MHEELNCGGPSFYEMVTSKHFWHPPGIDLLETEFMNKLTNDIHLGTYQWNSFKSMNNGDHTSTGSVSVENSERGFIVILACIVVDKVIILFTNFHVEKDFTVEFSKKYTV